MSSLARLCALALPIAIGALAAGAPPAPAARAQEPAATAVVLQTSVPTQTAEPTPTLSPAPPPSPAPTASPAPPPSATSPAAPGAPTGVATEVRALANEERPILVVYGVDANPDRPGAGDVFRLAVEVENVGEHLAENVQLTLGGETFLAVDGGSVLYANKVEEGDRHTFETDLRVAADAKAGVHPLTMALRWDDSYGGTYTDSASAGIEVSASVPRPIVVVTAARLPSRVAPGLAFSVALDLVNTGGREARNVGVVPTAGPLALQGGGGAPITLAPGAAATVVVRVLASTVADPGATSQTLELRYDDAEGTRFTESQTVGLVVTGDAASGPLPLVVRCGGCDEALHPGDIFDLALDVQNVGTADARRTRLAFGTGGAPAASGTGASATTGGTFALLGTSNVRFLDLVAVGETRTVRQRMVVDGAAKPGVYTLVITFSYVDADGQALESSEALSLLVSREAALEINPLEVITSTVVGEPVPFSVEIVNAGTASVNVTNAEVTGGRYLAVLDGARFVGPLDAGAADTLDATVTGRGPGRAELTVVVHYLDDFNREQSIEERFEITVDELPEAPAEDAEPPASGGGSLFLRLVKGLLGLGASPPPGGGSGAIGAPAVGDGPGGRPARGGAIRISPP